MFSFPDSLLKPGKVTDLLAPHDIKTFHEAVMWVWQLPYGRTSERSNYLLVPIEQRGACSAKHALLAEVAKEQSLPLKLFVGIFMMNRDNTPHIGSTLELHDLELIPEAHCYLKYGDVRYDFTMYQDFAICHPQIDFLYEEEIAADQIGRYKESLHQKWMKQWLRDSKLCLSFEEVWKIREECIEALSRRADPAF